MFQTLRIETFKLPDPSSDRWALVKILYNVAFSAIQKDFLVSNGQEQIICVQHKSRVVKTTSFPFCSCHHACFVIMT